MELDDLLENRENIDLMMDEPIKLIDKAKFIISHVFYFIRKFYDSKLINVDPKDFTEYLKSFKNKFKPQIISNKFSFDFLNKSYNDKFQESDSVDINNNSISKISNEENFYDLLYKKLINIINETDYSSEEKHIINSYMSIRNCLIFLEYLYVFLKQNPNEIFHYIIKIDISLLLDIPQKTSKRLINSNEFFYLNLIELKSLFPEIDYTPSSFIKNFESTLCNKYSRNVDSLKNKKLNNLKTQLVELCKVLPKYKTNNSQKFSSLFDYIYGIVKNLKLDLNNLTRNYNYNDLIKKYILEANKYEYKSLEQILEENDENEDIKGNINYLYLIALNNFGQLIKNNSDKINKDNNIESNEIQVNENKKICPENKKNISNISCEDNKVKDNSIKEINNNINIDINKNKKDFIIQIEELKADIKIIEDKDISELKMEEIIEEKNKYIDYMNRNFLYNLVLDLEEKNIYDILLFLDINEKTESLNSRNLDYIYKEHKNNFISSVKNLNPIDYHYFYDLISDVNFYNEIIDILTSKPIKLYLNNYRYYEEINEKNKEKNINIYDFEFVSNEEEFVENFSKEYSKLMNYLKDSCFFMNLFRLKFLPFGVRALVNYNLKIIFNPLYYEFNENINENNKKIVFRAALKIIIVHEMVHILKYLKNDANFNEMPGTPRNREAGKMLINFLFGKPVIKRINLEEAKKINDINYWDNIDKLKSIFQEEEDELSEIVKSERKISDHVDLYFTGEEIEDNDIKVDNIYNDIGIDID